MLCLEQSLSLGFLVSQLVVRLFLFAIQELVSLTRFLGDLLHCVFPMQLRALIHKVTALATVVALQGSFLLKFCTQGGTRVHALKAC
jgi:hypothetical protein